MKYAFCLAVVFVMMSVVTQASAEEWVLAGESRKPYLSCNTNSGKRLNWTKPVLRGTGGPQSIEREGEIDGRVLYEDRDVMSVVEWTRPVHDRNVDKLVIHLSASDMRNRTSLRVTPQIVLEGGSGYGGGDYSVYASPPARGAAGPVGALISSVVNRNYRAFDLIIYITNGGSCYDYPVTYHFRRVG